jgi:phosphatidylserine decarboxylase
MMTFHREGRSIMLGSIVIFLGLSALNYYFLASAIFGLFLFLQIGFCILLSLIIQFFRIPNRTCHAAHDDIICPADGKVVVIEEVEETEYFKGKRKQVSIFMSPINVHVTRYPVSGTIKYSKYHPGKYLVAWHPKSSEENERTTVVIRTPKFGDILYRQIAGALARRIVNYAEQGENVQQGEDAGFIKFGSRVDLFLPLDCEINVLLNQKVKGAVTCIATYVDPNEKEEVTY